MQVWDRKIINGIPTVDVIVNISTPCTACLFLVCVSYLLFYDISLNRARLPFSVFLSH